jgi:hypothetical protein
VKPISCNTYIKALNAFCKWLHDEGHAPERLESATLRLEKRMLQTLTDEQMQTLLSGTIVDPNSWHVHSGGKLPFFRQGFDWGTDRSSDRAQAGSAHRKARMPRAQSIVCHG